MRIAILGGTFDPIHNGHLAAAQSVAETFQVDELHFVPAFTPPHKISQGITSPFHRFAMVALATVSIERCRTSTIEVDALELHFVPAFTPPHKISQGITSPFHRFAMVALATVSIERCRTSTIEVDALEKRYTVETLESMKRKNPDDDLLFIIGTDM